MGEQNYPFHPAREQPDNQDQPYSPRQGHPSGSESALNPARILRNGQDVMLPTTSAPDYAFLLPPNRQQSLSQDLTPCSAVGSEADFLMDQYLLATASDENSQVSSFNLPAHYDASLITPVSMTGSPSLSTRAGSLVPGEKDIKHEQQLSPAGFSSYQFFPEEDDFASRYNQPMKPKRPSGGMHIQTADSGFPSTYVAPMDPYFGSYGVSATPSSRATDTPPSLNYSPSLNSAGGHSNASYHSNHQTPPQSATSSHSYRSVDQTPILIAPNPLNLRAAAKEKKLKRRQRSAPIHSSTSSIMDSRINIESPEYEDSTSPPRGRKRKGRATSTPLEDLTLPDDLSRDDRLLLELRLQGLEWKEISKRFEEVTQQSLSTACLQMRKKRLVDRIKENPLNATTQWDSIPRERVNEHIPKYGEAPRQTSSPRNWADSRSALSSYQVTQTYPAEFERLIPIERAPRNTWSELGSPHAMKYEGVRLHSALSTASMDDIRHRAILDSNPHCYSPRHENDQGYGYGHQQELKSEGQGGHEQRRNW